MITISVIITCFVKNNRVYSTNRAGVIPIFDVPRRTLGKGSEGVGEVGKRVSQSTVFLPERAKTNQKKKKKPTNEQTSNLLLTKDKCFYFDLF